MHIPLLQMTMTKSKKNPKPSIKSCHSLLRSDPNPITRIPLPQQVPVSNSITCLFARARTRTRTRTRASKPKLRFLADTSPRENAHSSVRLLGFPTRTRTRTRTHLPPPHHPLPLVLASYLF